ncbi:MAG: LysR family transcriptional regulator [Tranquillimonas sp.]
MEIGWLEDLAALAETENFSRAAQRRNVTQPAFSRRIQALETWVGTPLVARTSRSVSLTPAGQVFRSRAEGVVRDLARARQEALESAGRIETTLTMAATHALSFTFVPGWFSRTADLAALSALNLISDSMEACESAMSNGEASFLLCHQHPEVETRLNRRQFRHKIVGRDELVPLCVPDADGAPRWRLTGDGDRPIPFLGYSTPSGLGRILNADLARHSGSRPLETVVRSRLAATLLEMARQGRGLAWLPRSLARAEIESGALADAADGARTVPLDITLFRPAITLGSTAERFWDRVAPRTAPA